MSTDYGHATIDRVRNPDPANLKFDGKKADLYINTNRLGGEHYLVKVENAKGEPTLIAIHL